MLQYTKYILFRLVGPMLLISLSLAAIAWLAYSLRFIDLIVNRGLSLGTFLYLSSLLLPYILWPVVPIALFISILIVYHRLSNDSELIILSNSGVSKWGLFRPILYFASLTAMVSFLIGNYILPTAYREFKDLQTFIRDNYAALLLQEGVFSTPMKGFTVYMRERTDNGLLRGLIVHDDREENKTVTYMAEQGKIVKGSTGIMLMLDSGNRQEINQKTDEFSLLFFERYALDLDLFQKNPLGDRWREPTERYLDELFFPDDLENEEQRLALLAEGHFRLTWPLYSLLFSLLAYTVFASGEYNRRGQPRRIVYAVIGMLSCLGAAFGFNSLIARNAHHAFSPYLFLLLSSLVTCLYIWRDRLRFAPPFFLQKKRS